MNFNTEIRYSLFFVFVRIKAVDSNPNGQSTDD